MVAPCFGVGCEVIPQTLGLQRVASVFLDCSNTSPSKCEKDFWVRETHFVDLVEEGSLFPAAPVNIS